MQKLEIIKNRNDNIEILRAVAILLVLSIHMGLVLPFPSSLYTRLIQIFDGSVGVDLFFVISGYVITRSLVYASKNSSGNKISVVSAFWLKRIFRLLPTSILWLFIIIFYMWAVGLLCEGNDFRIEKLIPIFAACANVFNVYNAYCVANPGDSFWCNAYLFYGHYWSLSLEQQFYIVFPMVFSLFSKRFLRVLMIAVIALSLFWSRPYWSYGWFLRIDGFCWGILLGLIPIMTLRIPLVDKLLKNNLIIQTLSVGLIVSLPFLSRHLQGFGASATMYGIGVLAMISAILVFLAVRYENSLGTQPHFKKLMLYIGSRSYSIYIIHLIMFEIIKHFWAIGFGEMKFTPVEMQLTNIGIVILALTITFVLSEMNYQFVEQHFRVKGKHLAQTILSRG